MRKAHERLGNADVVGHDQGLGLEAQLGGERGAALGQARAPSYMA